ncbi:MAG TPA: hypothetical protein VGL61_24175 [Kofleriaceae bacterium]
MRSWIWVAAVGAVAVAACKFNAGTGQTDAKAPIDAPTDAPIDAVVNPDGGTCTGASVQCLPDNITLRTCAAQNDNPVDTACAWGCITANTPHCGQLVPTGSAATGSDVLDGSGQLAAVTLPDGTQIDPMSGAITNGPTMIRKAGMGISTSHIDFEIRNGVAVFRFAGLTIAGQLTFKEPAAQTLYPAVALVSTQDLAVDGAIDAQGNCVGGNGGPGGQVGAKANNSAGGSGGGSADPNMDRAQGAGGGGYGAAGGSGGNGDTLPSSPAGGSGFEDPLITVLIGGGGGGGGAGTDGNAWGGGGGGAIQLVANGRLAIGSDGSINAGGCGGISSQSNKTSSGGGGGAGGAILLEAHDITIAGPLAVNGGGGGAANSGSPGDQGSNAGLGRGAAQGSTNDEGGAAGGNGGYALSLAGLPGASTNGWGGGGGGGVGRMRFNTYAGSASVADEDQLSPNLSDNQSTCTQGVAQTQ